MLYVTAMSVNFARLIITDKSAIAKRWKWLLPTLHYYKELYTVKCVISEYDWLIKRGD